MNIHPQDLGRRYSSKILAQRGLCNETEPGLLFVESEGDRRISRIGSSVLAVMLAAMLLVGALLHGGLNEAGIVLIIVVAALYHFLSVQPRKASERINGAISAFEISQIWADQGDNLGSKYLGLVQTAIDLPAAGDEAAERNVREAVRALGTAIEDLPAQGPELVSDDPNALQAEAAQMTSQANAEPDSVIAASLWRRADSLARRAETAARTLMLLRRNQALRDEVAEQIDALRTSLTAFRVGGRQSATELADLAASIHRVALEANAMTTARAEIDTLLSLPQVLEPASEAQAQPLRRSNG